MPVEDFIIRVYCLIDDFYKIITEGKRIRAYGPNPKLTDVEVITMEIVGEFMGIDNDTAIHKFFVNHWRKLFPNIGDRSAFSRQAQNLWSIKQKIQDKCIAILLRDGDQGLRIIDGFPMPICNFKRAHFLKIFRNHAGYGYCAAKNQTYYGFKGHLLTDENGVIIGITVTNAKCDEREALFDLTNQIPKHLLGDKGYICNDVKKDNLKDLGISLHTPLRSNMKDDRSKAEVRRINAIRRIIESVIGQLTERFNIEKVRARTVLSLTNRITRKILGYNLSRLIARSMGNFTMKLGNIISA